MKILFVGVLDAPWSTNIPMKQEMEKLGHQVDSFNYRTISESFGKNKNLILEKFASRFWRGLYFKIHGRKEMNQNLLSKIKNNNYDLVFLCKTDSVDFRLLKEINKYAKTYYFFMDPIKFARKIKAHIYARKCNFSSATFSDVNEFFKKFGANSIFLTQGLDKNLFYPEKARKDIEVIFVGTIDKRRKGLINYLVKHNIKVICFGHGWKNRQIFREELVDYYRRAKIILNICRSGQGFSIRIFQAMGTGSFMLSQYCPDLEKIFVGKKHLDWFNSKKECLDLVRYYLANESEREKIAQQGAEFVAENYSWEKIIARILRRTRL